MTESSSEVEVFIEVDSEKRPVVPRLEVTGGDIVNFTVKGGRAAVTIPVRGWFLEGSNFKPIGYGKTSDFEIQRLEHCIIEDGKRVRFQLNEDPKGEMEVWYTVVCEDVRGWYFAHGSSPPRMIIRPRE